MKVGELSVCVLAIAALFLASCASQRSAQTSTAEKQSSPPTQGAADQETTKQNAATRKPDQDAAATTEFVASEELYHRTFDEVQKVIAELTALIAAGDYDGWLSHLTADYITRTGSPEHLAEASNAGVLKKNGIVLHTLKDYFTEVVVRSHMTATLNDITFVDATHVKAITRIQGKPVILYYLVREDGRWKVGIQQSTQNE